MVSWDNVRSKSLNHHPKSMNREGLDQHTNVVAPLLDLFQTIGLRQKLELLSNILSVNTDTIYE